MTYSFNEFGKFFPNSLERKPFLLVYITPFFLTPAKTRITSKLSSGNLCPMAKLVWLSSWHKIHKVITLSTGGEILTSLINACVEKHVKYIVGLVKESCHMDNSGIKFLTRTPTRRVGIRRQPSTKNVI